MCNRQLWMHGKSHNFLFFISKPYLLNVCINTQYICVCGYFLHVCHFMFVLCQWTGGTECTNKGLESAASLAMQSAGFQPVVRLQQANLVSQAGNCTVPKHAARQHSFLCLICCLNALSHKTTQHSLFLSFFLETYFLSCTHCSLQIFKKIT